VNSLYAYLAGAGINLLQVAVGGISARVANGQAFDKWVFLFQDDLRRLLPNQPQDFFTRFSTNGTVIDLLLISIGLMALATLSRFARDFIHSEVSLRLRHQLRKDVFDGLVGEPAETRSMRPEGTTAEIFRSDIDGTAQLLVFGVLNTLESLYVMTYFSYKVTRVGGWFVLPLFFLLSLVSQVGIVLLTRRRERQTMDAAYLAQQTAAAQSNRLFRLFAELLARGGERREGERAVSAWDRAARLNTNYGLWAGGRGASNEALQYFIMPVILISIVCTQRPGPQLMGAIVALPAFLGQITPALTALITVPSMLLQYRPGLRSVAGLLEYAKPRAKPPEFVMLQGNKKPADVTFEDVTAVFDAATGPILKGISFTIPAGKRVGLVAKSGSGKTTLGRILAGEQVPYRGRVLLDGVDITHWPFLCRRELVGLLYAEPGFLLDTLRANVCFGRKVDPERFKQASRVAGVTEIVSGRERAWEELITPDVQLSSGEKRKVGLARFLASPYPYRVLVLDEPFANVDAEGVRDLAARVAVATQGVTSLIITHDPDVIQTDFNLFLKDGSIVATGTHDELVRSNGDYAELVRRENVLNPKP
jgi:ABC-type multidrug transport system fused ATPase/permease subunit